MATGISWTDATLNLVVGCTKISPGCKNCYAKAVTERWPGRFPEGFDNVTLKPERLHTPHSWRKPRRVFVNSMSDTFHEKVPRWYLKAMWRLFEDTPRHTYQILTKRPERMEAMFFQGILPVLPNVWLGVSAEDQKHWDERVPILVCTPAAVRFVSCEPLLGPIAIGLPIQTVDWIIVGGESGRNWRPMVPAWAEAIRDQCRASGIAFFYKQHSKFRPGGDDKLEGVAYREFPEVAA